MNKENLSFLMKYIKKYALYLIISLVCSLVLSASILSIPYIVGITIDLMVDVNQVDIHSIINNCILILVISLAISLCQYLSNIINNKISFSIVRDLRKDLNEKIHRLPLKYLDNQPVGEVVNKIINDVETISDGLVMGFNQLFVNVITIVFALTIMFILNYIIALVVFILTPLSIFFARFISKSTYSLFKKQSQIKAKQSGFVNEMITNQKVVQVFNMEEQNNDRFDIINQELEKTTTKAVFFSSLVNPSTRFINALIYAGVALIGALICLSPNPIKIGILSSFLGYVNQYTKPFNEITNVISELQNAFSSTSRVRELLNQEEEIEDGKEELLNPSGNIKLDRINFSYSDKVKLIQNLSLNIKKGTKVAIVGPTGCGKTTLINLLMRFYDVNSGDILIDDISIKNLKRHSLRDSYGMVLQETWLKETSIKDNVKMGKEDASDEEVISALKECYCLNFVNQLENGIDTIIKEEGEGLSQGQKQLLCISRIMLTKPPILILDEATSSIDTRTEIKIQKAFEKLMKGKTSFIVAHRLSTIKNADLILVMNKGNVIEKGTHEELMKNKGFYYELFTSQYQHEN